MFARRLVAANHTLNVAIGYGGALAAALAARGRANIHNHVQVGAATVSMMLLLLLLVLMLVNAGPRELVLLAVRNVLELVEVLIGAA